MEGLQGVLGARRRDPIDFAAGAGASAGMRGWSYYLIASAFLVAVLVPSGPGQLAIIDAVNFIAFAIFGMWTLLRGRPVIVPFALPMLLIFVGSLIATV